MRTFLGLMLGLGAPLLGLVLLFEVGVRGVDFADETSFALAA